MSEFLDKMKKRNDRINREQELKSPIVLKNLEGQSHCGAAYWQEMQLMRMDDKIFKLEKIIEKFNKEFRDLQAEVTQINTKVLQLEEALEILLEMKKHGRKNTRKSKRNGGKRK